MVDSQALSSALALFGMLQPQVFESLKTRRDLGLGLELLFTRVVYALFTCMQGSHVLLYCALVKTVVLLLPFYMMSW